MTRIMRGRIGSSASSSASITIVTPARAACSARDSATSATIGKACVDPSPTTSCPDSSSERKRMSSMSSRTCATSACACSIKSCASAPGRSALSEEGEQAGERRPELVRDGGGEAGAQLLVGGHVAGVPRVDERLPSALDFVRNLDRSGREEPVGDLCAFSQPRDGLARAPAGGHDPSSAVEDDDDLAALLHERPAPPRLEAQLVHRSRRSRRRLAPETIQESSRGHQRQS